jgi:gliding motility-associated-like protein
MKKLLTLLLFIPFALSGQNYCDVELIDFNWVDETVTFTVLADSCYTPNNDFDPNNPTIITAQVYLWDPFTNLGILAPCWGIPLQGSGISTWNPAVVGDTITLNFASFQTCELANEIANGNICNFTATLSVNGSPPSGDDFPNNNSLTFYNVCPCDPIIEYIYETDTLYIETIDTLYVTEVVYITDTLYIDVIIDNYIYITDTLTLTEYIFSTEYIDCETGEPCEEDPGIDGCDDNSIFIPNTFTPNNDGVNDVFYTVTDATCWLTWKFQIYNRWGTLVKEMKDPLDHWTGVSRSGHWLCPDGVYTWKLDATQPGAATQLNGHVTIFR